MNSGYGFIAVLLVGIAGVVGWVMNIVTIFGADFNDITGVLVCRIIGVFIAPIGAILGYL